MTSLEDGSDGTTIAIEPAVIQSSDSNEPINLFTDETVENLTNGFLEILQPEVTRVQKSLEELMLVLYNGVGELSCVCLE